MVEVKRERILTLRVTEPDGKGLGGSLTLSVVGGNVVDPRSVRTDVGRKLHVRRDCFKSVQNSSLIAPSVMK